MHSKIKYLALIFFIQASIVLAEEDAQKITLTKEKVDEINKKGKKGVLLFHEIYLVQTYPLQINFYPYVDNFLQSSIDEGLKESLKEWHDHLTDEQQTINMFTSVSYATKYHQYEKNLEGLKYIHAVCFKLVELTKSEDKEISTQAIEILRMFAPSTREPRTVKWFQTEFFNWHYYPIILKSASEGILVEL